MPRRNQPESIMQQQVAQVLDAAGCLWCHVPNGGKRSPIEAAIMKGMGVKPGVPDILIFDAPPVQNLARATRGAAIELKAPGGSLTENQRQWLESLYIRDWLTAACYSTDEALHKLEEWGYINLRGRAIDRVAKTS